MKKLLFSLALSCLAVFGFADLNLANPLPKGPITARGSKLYTGTREAFLFGANYTFDSVTALSPKEFAQDCLKRGMNWVRLHKLKDGIDPLPIMDALYAVGIRSSVDVLLAEDAPQFYSGDLTKFNAKVAQLEPVLKHPGLFMVCMVNEGGHLINPLSANTSLSILLGKASLRSAGFTGLITDLPDAAINPPLYQGATAHLDVVTSHGYGYHPKSEQVVGKPPVWFYQEPIWELNPHFSGVSYWLRDLTGKPILFQEIGCLFPDQRRHINEAFFAAECLARGASGLCLFQWASNHAQMRGEASSIDMFSISTDPLRQVSFIAGALLAKTKSSPTAGNTLAPWTVENKLGPYGGSLVFKSGKQRVVILFGRSAVDGFKSHDVGAGWMQIDSFGSRKMWHPEGDWFDLGAPVATAYRVDTFSMGRTAQMQVEGNRFQPDRELGVYEVTLK